MKQFDFDEEVAFVARHYKRGAFAIGTAWKRVSPTRRRWGFSKIAVVLVIVGVAGAMAAVWMHDFKPLEVAPPEVTQPAETKTVSPERKVIDFDDAALPLVVEKIIQTYGVTVTNLPEDAEDYHLTLHYEGTAAELIETINEILTINLELQ